MPFADTVMTHHCRTAIFLPKFHFSSQAFSHILFPNFIWIAWMHDPVTLTGWQVCSSPDLTIIPLCPSLLLMWVSLSQTLLLTIHHCHWFPHTLGQQVNGRDAWKQIYTHKFRPQPPLFCDIYCNRIFFVIAFLTVTFWETNIFAMSMSCSLKK